MPFPPRLVSVLLLVAALPARPAPVRARPPGERPGPERVLARFAVAKGGALLLLPVELGGKEIRCALDTGASSCAYDSSLAPLLGEPVRTEDVRTSDGLTRVRFFRPPDAKLGSLSLRTGSAVVAADLRRIREASGEEVYGLIGMDFLAAHVVRIDPDRGEVLFLRSPGPDPGERVPLSFRDKVPHVRVGVSGIDEPQLFLVDTGCSPGGGTGLMRAETFDALLEQGRIRPAGDAWAQSLSGTTLRRRGKVGGISLSGHRHSDLIFSASQRNILGLNYWSRYVATFDFPGGAVYLKRGSKFDRPDLRDLSGLALGRFEGRTRVLSVRDGSPAALAGVRPQDVILKAKADGEQAEDIPLTTLRRLLAADGAKLSLLLRRGDEEREVSLVLRHWHQTRGPDR